MTPEGERGASRGRGGGRRDSQWKEASGNKSEGGEGEGGGRSKTQFRNSRVWTTLGFYTVLNVFFHHMYKDTFNTIFTLWTFYRWQRTVCTNLQISSCTQFYWTFVILTIICNLKGLNLTELASIWGEDFTFLTYSTCISFIIITCVMIIIGLIFVHFTDRQDQCKNLKFNNQYHAQSFNGPKLCLNRFVTILNKLNGDWVLSHLVSTKRGWNQPLAHALLSYTKS